MDTVRPCGCKGRRSCLLCEKEYNIEIKPTELKKENSYVYCPFCNKCFKGWDMDEYKLHPNHNGLSLEFPGVYIQLDFLCEEEEELLVKYLDEIPWDLSQSGRRKQNFGPKCNFKKKKLQIGNFNGFPNGTKFVQDKFKEVDILNDFQTIEQCTLEYDPFRGASIDPHVDDCWIWGERIVTVNMLSDSVLTMTLNDKPNSYNLDSINEYIKFSNENNILESGTICEPIVRIPMPNRSLIVLYGRARYNWEHRVLREDILSRRLCLAYREFTPPYLPGQIKYCQSKEIFQKANNFWELNDIET